MPAARSWAGNVTIYRDALLRDDHMTARRRRHARRRLQALLEEGARACCARTDRRWYNDAQINRPLTLVERGASLSQAAAAVGAAHTPAGGPLG